MGRERVVLLLFCVGVDIFSSVLVVLVGLSLGLGSIHALILFICV